jgi:membrane-associated phospholipid phosphatase
MQMRRTAGGTVRDRIDAADQAIMARLSAESSPVLDHFLPTLSRSADFFMLWIGIAAALAASNDERGRRAALRGLAGMVIASTASNVLAKGLVRRPRPAGKVPPDRRPGRTPVTTSFPSGHAAAAAAFATGVGLEMPALAVPVGALAAAVGVARVVNGVHYPSDIAGGWVVGVGIGMLTLRWWPPRRSKPAAVTRPRHEAPPTDTDSSS